VQYSTAEGKSERKSEREAQRRGKDRREEWKARREPERERERESERESGAMEPADILRPMLRGWTLPLLAFAIGYVLLGMPTLDEKVNPALYPALFSDHSVIPCVFHRKVFCFSIYSGGEYSS
jgi:hypothetical protein